jgi:uncharacterized protein YqgQ
VPNIFDKVQRESVYVKYEFDLIRKNQWLAGRKALERETAPEKKPGKRGG